MYTKIEKFTDIESAWNFLDTHPYFIEFTKAKKGKWFADYNFKRAYDFNMMEGVVDMEVGPFYLGDVHGDGEILSVKSHDYALDSYGDSFDEAIINMANNVLEHVGPAPECSKKWLPLEINKEVIDYLLSKGVEIDIDAEEIIKNAYKFKLKSIEDLK